MYKKISVLILLFILGIVSTGFGESKVVEKKLTWDMKLKSDLNYMVRSLEEIHPDLYSVIGKSKFKHEQQRIEGLINKKMTRIEFYKQIAPMIALLGDGHTAVNVPFRYLAMYVRKGGLIFPFDVNCRLGKVVIRSNYSSDRSIRKGTEILKINGINSDVILNKFTSFISGRRKESRLSLAGDLFSIFLYILYDFKSDFDVTLKGDRWSKPFQRIIKGKTIKEINTIRKGEDKTNRQKFSYLPLPEVNGGVMDIRSFSSGEQFAEFLKKSFRKIKKDKVRTLIIDIRKNNGGDSRLGELLLGYLTSGPVSVISKTKMKISRQIKTHFGKNLPELKKKGMDQSILDYVEKIINSKTGSVVELLPGIKKAGKNDLLFKGKVYVLTGVKTFSSAVLFAAAIKDYKIGTIVGEETGAPASHFGEIHSILLPHSELTVNVSYKYFIRPDGKTGPAGVIPDLKVPEDKALDTVKKRIRKIR